MARNTQVEADTHAPPITQVLAKFVATHPSRGWSDAVDHEAHRTFLNWVGCAVGAARHGQHAPIPAPESLRIMVELGVCSQGRFVDIRERG